MHKMCALWLEWKRSKRNCMAKRGNSSLFGLESVVRVKTLLKYLKHLTKINHIGHLENIVNMVGSVGETSCFQHW